MCIQGLGKERGWGPGERKEEGDKRESPGRGRLVSSDCVGVLGRGLRQNSLKPPKGL